MHCLKGTEPRKVERPQNWKEATDQGYAPPVYDSDEQRRAVQKDFLTKVGNNVLCAHCARSSCTRTQTQTRASTLVHLLGRVHLRVRARTHSKQSCPACVRARARAHWRAGGRACLVWRKAFSVQRF